MTRLKPGPKPHGAEDGSGLVRTNVYLTRAQLVKLRQSGMQQSAAARTAINEWRPHATLKQAKEKT